VCKSDMLFFPAITEKIFATENTEKNRMVVIREGSTLWEIPPDAR
jgi:hypothetical protein